MKLRMVSPCVVGLLALLAAADVRAQTEVAQSDSKAELPPATMLDSESAWHTTWSPANGCQASIQTPDMVRVLESLDARMAPRTDTSITLEADLIAKEVAAELRTMLGGSESVVPDATARVKWYSIPAELIVTPRPDGRMTWRGLSRSGDTSATRLLAAALDSARRHGGALMIWPDGNSADSLVAAPLAASHWLSRGSGVRHALQQAIEVQGIHDCEPPWTPALPIEGRRKPTYPQSNQTH